MTAVLGSGGYNYQTPTMRALGSITPESYDYRDEAKTLSKLINDTSFMAGMMRKMQRGIDDANQNFVQQIQSLVVDVLTLLGGGGDTGLDFGDLKYILQAIGALFGFFNEEGELTLPVNLFNSAWHFFSNYIGITTNFEELINQLIDSAIATVLDLFGEVPIVGQALQQLAVILSDIRDLLNPIADAVQTFFDAFSIDITDLPGISGLFGPFAPIVDALIDALDGIVLPDFSIVFHQIALWTLPVVNAIAAAITLAAKFVKLLLGTATATELSDAFKAFSLHLDPTAGGGSGFNTSQWAVGAINNFFNSIGAGVTTFLSALIPGLDASKIISGQLPQTMVSGLVEGLQELYNFIQETIIGLVTGESWQELLDTIWQSMFGGSSTGFEISDVFTALTNIPGVNIVSAILAAIIPGLDASKIVSGAFSQSQITNLITDLSAKLGLNVFNAAANAGTNLVISPSFEDNTILREAVGASGTGYSTEQAHSGTRSFKLVAQNTGASSSYVYFMPTSMNTGADSMTASTAIRVKGGDKFYFEAWIKSHASNAAGGNIRLGMTAVDALGNIIYPETSFSIPAPGAAWTKIGTYLTVPANYILIWPYIVTGSTASGAQYYVDDVVVHEETAPQNIIEQLTNAIKQYSGGSGWSLTDMFNTVFGQSGQIGVNSAQIAAIQARLDATTSGNSLTGKDTFEYTDTDSLDLAVWNGPEYLVGTSAEGYLRTDGHNAYSVHNNGGNWDIFYRFNGTNHITQTSYQKITFNWAWQMAYAPLFGDDRKAHWCVYARMNAARTQWVRLKISSPDFAGTQAIGQWQYKNGGGIVNLGSSFTFDNPTVGQPITVEAGTAGGLRQFRASTNTAVLNTTTDGSSVTAEGVNNREGGIGAGYTNDEVLTGQHGSMGGIIQWVMTDNTTVTTVGSYGRWYRSSTSGASAGGTGDRVLPSTFDTTERASSDLAFTGGNKVQVSITGTYRIDFMVHNVAGMITSNVEPLLYITPSGGGQALKRRGPHQYFDGASHTRVGGSWTEYLNAGDAVQCGVNSPSFTPSWAGDAGGTLSYMTIALQPPPLAT